MGPGEVYKQWVWRVTGNAGVTPFLAVVRPAWRRYAAAEYTVLKHNLFVLIKDKVQFASVVCGEGHLLFPETITDLQGELVSEVAVVQDTNDAQFGVGYVTVRTCARVHL
ncbi:hypothetical protein [Haloarcula amylovorans]|uniref:hypothetical protein n=1 Tax=Haloarcula amylovorans TaxID=2562280 RepID=UPI0010760651|nr:hypothetical protein [Halomicroarcula amylolytica]